MSHYDVLIEKEKEKAKLVTVEEEVTGKSIWIFSP